MNSKISRRNFLKAGLTMACSIAAAGPAGRAAAAFEKKELLATLIDVRKCIGCEACVYACREANAGKFPEPEKPFPRMYPDRVPVMDWSGKRDVTDRLTPYNWLYIQRASVEINGKKTDISLPRRCMHCVNPPCVRLCPWGAARQYDDGISAIDPELCLGGSKCKNVCPWGIPERQTGVGLYLDFLPSLAGNGVMYKCDRCVDRIRKGGIPACIEACPEHVQSIGPREEILRKAHQIAEEIDGYIYGEHENGGTNTIYVSPVPFQELNEAIDKGKGKPHLQRVKDKMAAGNNLAKAMIIAPVAGVAAAFGKFYRTMREDDK